MSDARKLSISKARAKRGGTSRLFSSASQIREALGRGDPRQKVMSAFDVLKGGPGLDAVATVPAPACAQ